MQHVETGLQVGRMEPSAGGRLRGGERNVCVYVYVCVCERGRRCLCTQNLRGGGERRNGEKAG